MKAIIHPRIGLRWTDVILALDLSAPAAARAPHVHITIETVPADAPPSRLAGLPDHRSKAVLEARRRRGDTCVVARQGKRIVGFGWLARGPWVLRDAGLEFRLDPTTEAIVYDAFTAAGYRGQGIMQEVIRGVAEVARAQGHERLYARAERDNISSIMALERMRFVQFASITTLRVLVFAAFHVIDIVDENDAFYQHARRHLRRTGLGVMRWRFRGRNGNRRHISTHVGG